jgi:hypothetical protein
MVLLGAGAWFGYRQVAAAGPAKTFDRFAEAWTRGRTEAALDLSDGDSMRRTLEKKTFIDTMCPPWTVDAFHGFRTEVISSATNASGDVELDARQTVAFDPPGATSGLGGAAVATFHHRATMRKTSGGWRVVSFVPKCDGVRMARDRR